MRTPEEKRKNREHELELAGPFLTVLAVLTLVAFLLPLRPETSMRERRRLREFPAFSVESLLSGDWFDGITAWFSDSFPGRETMLEVSNRMDALHGLNKNEVAWGPAVPPARIMLSWMPCWNRRKRLPPRRRRNPKPLWKRSRSRNIAGRPIRTRSSKAGKASTPRTKPQCTAIWS